MKWWISRYEGNHNLCNPNNVICQPSPKPNIGLIIGASVGAILFLISIVATILCIVKRRKNRDNVTDENKLLQTSLQKYKDPHGMSYYPQ